jgi:DnaJ-domain-containing protein 1
VFLGIHNKSYLKLKKVIDFPTINAQPQNTKENIERKQILAIWSASRIKNKQNVLSYSVRANSPHFN